MFRGGTKTFGRTLTPPRPDSFGMPQQSDEYFAPNPVLSAFGMGFAHKFGGDDQKIKKDLHRKILGYLSRSLDLSCCFIKKKRLWRPVFEQNFAGIFDWGRAKPKMTCNDVIKNFRKRNKDIVECMIRSCGLVWH